MSHTRSCPQRFADRLSAIGTYIANFISPLKAISQAIYKIEPIKDFSDGFTQVMKVPQLLKDPERAKKTRVLVYNSFISNIPKYLLVVMMYRRLANIVYEDSPSLLQYAVAGFDAAIMGTLVLRLFVRRAVENTLYTGTLARAISNDRAEFLINKMSQLLSHEIARTISNIFSMHNVSDSLYQQLMKELPAIVEKIAVNKDFTEAKFRETQGELALLFLKLVTQLDNLKVSDSIAKEVCDLIAKSIIDEFSAAILLSPRIELEDTLEKNQRALVKSLSRVFIDKRAQAVALGVLKEISHIREEVQSLLPAKYIKSCECGMPKVPQASLSSPMYFAGNVLMTYLPEFLEALGLNSRYFIYGKAAGAALRALLNGQSLIEARLSAAGLCTRHRYMTASRNKARLVGQGAAYLLSVEAVQWLFKCYSGVENAYTRDSIASFLLLVNLIPAHAFNEPLPGKKMRPLDVFLPSRKVIFWATKELKGWILPDFKNKDARENCINNIRKILQANWFHSSIYLLLGSSEFLPLNELNQLRRERSIEQEISSLHPNFNSVKRVRAWESSTRSEIESLFTSEKELREFRLSKNLLNKTENLLEERKKIKKKKYPVRVLCENKSVRVFIKSFEQDIKAGIAYAEFLRRLSPWLVKPISILPIQGGLISMIEVPMHLLNEESLDEVIRQIRAQLLEIDADNFERLGREAKYFTPPVIHTVPSASQLKKIEPDKVSEALETKAPLAIMPPVIESPKMRSTTALINATLQISPRTPELVVTDTSSPITPPRSSFLSFDACCAPELQVGPGDAPIVVAEPPESLMNWQETPPVTVEVKPSLQLAQPSSFNWLRQTYHSGVSGLSSLTSALTQRSKANKDQEPFELRSWR